MKLRTLILGTLGLYVVALLVRLVADFTGLWLLPIATPLIVLALALLGLYRVGSSDESRRPWSKDGYKARLTDRTALLVVTVIVAEVASLFMAGSVLGQPWWVTTIVLLPVVVIGALELPKLSPVDESALDDARTNLSTVFGWLNVNEVPQLSFDGQLIVLALTDTLRAVDDDALNRAVVAGGYEVVERTNSSLRLSQIRYADATDDDRPVPFVQLPQGWGED